jgi:hypothetical protein
LGPAPAQRRAWSHYWQRCTAAIIGGVVSRECSKDWNAERELDSASAASPERWAGGRRQRARHTRALALGLRCYPVRVVLAASKGAARRHDVVVARRRRGRASLGRPLHEQALLLLHVTGRCFPTIAAIDPVRAGRHPWAQGSGPAPRHAPSRPQSMPSSPPSMRRSVSIASHPVGQRLQQGAPTSSIDCSAHRSPFAVRPAQSLSVSVVFFLSVSSPGPLMSLPWPASHVGHVARRVPRGQLRAG